MAVRYRKRIRITNWLHLNLSKSGASVSIGPRGLNMNIGPRGVYSNLGIPGTGITSRSKLDSVSSCERLKYNTPIFTTGCLWTGLMFFSIFAFFVLLVVSVEYIHNDHDFSTTCLIVSSAFFILSDVFYSIARIDEIDTHSLLRRLLIYFIVLVVNGCLSGLCYHKYIDITIVEDIIFPFLMLSNGIVLLCFILALIKLLTIFVYQIISSLFDCITNRIHHKDESNEKHFQGVVSVDASSNLFDNQKIDDIICQVFEVLKKSIKNQLFNKRINKYTIKQNGIPIENIDEKFCILFIYDIIKCYTQIYKNVDLTSKEVHILMNVVSAIENYIVPKENDDKTQVYGQKQLVKLSVQSVYQIVRQTDSFFLYIPSLFDTCQKNECMKYMLLLGQIISRFIYFDKEISDTEMDFLVKFNKYRDNILERYNQGMHSTTNFHSIDITKRIESKQDIKWEVAQYILNRKKCDVYEIAEDFRITVLEAEHIRKDLEDLGVIIYDGFGLPEFVTSERLQNIISQNIQK